MKIKIIIAGLQILHINKLVEAIKKETNENWILDFKNGI